ncbi:hypothetical protein RF11_15181 [Thelohanellus kitauei]|uniref:Reverse transcriptase domain-containing protein n=1 Tax=Thelohanellus kitauei TaxID=669202 RepID=A0A0C2NF97_THEKT|nr:hypothetical protein RF11_15181 [Thelohanellus kitauei]
MSDWLSGIRLSCYLQDIIITSLNKEEQLTNIQVVLVRLEQCGLTAYLGHVIDKNLIVRTTKIIEPTINSPEHRSIKQLKSFLGAMNYYSKFVPLLHARCTKFYELTRKGMKWELSQELKKNDTPMTRKLVPFFLIRLMGICGDQSGIFQERSKYIRRII